MEAELYYLVACTFPYDFSQKQLHLPQTDQMHQQLEHRTGLKWAKMRKKTAITRSQTEAATGTNAQKQKAGFPQYVSRNRAGWSGHHISYLSSSVPAAGWAPSNCRCCCPAVTRAARSLPAIRWWQQRALLQPSGSRARAASRLSWRSFTSRPSRRAPQQLPPDAFNKT